MKCGTKNEFYKVYWKMKNYKQEDDNLIMYRRLPK